LSRGIAGHIEDKHWGKYIGNRNCGKGVFEVLLRNALGNYYASADAGNFLVNSNRQLKGEQVEKQMAFALDFMFARICCSQEMPPPTKNNTIKMNGELFKKLCSGGDRLKAKRNYDIYITEFINQARLIIMCNDCPPLTNDDALETCFEFDNVVQFISQDDFDNMKNKYARQVERGDMTENVMELLLEKYRIGNPNIKSLCETVEYSNAFIQLICQNYGDLIMTGNIALKNDDDDDVDDNSNLRKFILDHFEITNDNNDYLTTSDISDLFDECEFGDISKKKIASEFKALGSRHKVKKIGGKATNCWVGVMKKKQEEDNEK
jgi:hypothetical protein